jgi:hypothetical protein
MYNISVILRAQIKVLTEIVYTMKYKMSLMIFL